MLLASRDQITLKKPFHCIVYTPNLLHFMQFRVVATDSFNTIAAKHPKKAFSTQKSIPTNCFFKQFGMFSPFCCFFKQLGMFSAFTVCRQFHIIQKPRAFSFHHIQILIPILTHTHSYFLCNDSFHCFFRRRHVLSRIINR